MTRHTARPIQALQLSMTNEPFSQLVHQWQGGRLDPNPPYQRGQVWTRAQKIALIESVMTGTPIPAIIVNRRTRAGTRYVIDGLQRITAYREWLEGNLLVPASWFAPGDVLVPFDLDANHALGNMYGDTGLYVAYTGLTEYAQSLFDNASVSVAEGRFATERGEARVYLRVNGYGTAQTAVDLDRARRVAEGGA